jgi:SRSO17 transposase
MARQFTSSAAKIINSRIDVFASYVSHHGHTLIDRALYLPRPRAGDAARVKAVHVPAGKSLLQNPAWRLKACSGRLNSFPRMNKWRPLGLLSFGRAGYLVWRI